MGSLRSDAVPCCGAWLAAGLQRGVGGPGGDMGIVGTWHWDTGSLHREMGAVEKPARMGTGPSGASQPRMGGSAPSPQLPAPSGGAKIMSWHAEPG